jgi:hypothetical protein
MSIIYIAAYDRQQWQDTIFDQPQIMEIYAHTQRLMGKQEMFDFEYIRSDSGAIKRGALHSTNHENLRQYAFSVYQLNQAVEAQGGRMLFMGTPPSINEGDSNTFAGGFPVYQYMPDQDTLYHYLREFGVDYLDVRDIINRGSISPDMVIHRTSPSWTIWASFEAFKGIVDKMERLYGISLDPYRFYRDIDNYDIEIQDGAFLGSFGSATHSLFSGYDDLVIFRPKFDVQPNPDAPRLLFIHYSIEEPMVMFLTPLFSEIHEISPERVDVRKYIEEHGFDYVIYKVKYLR